MKNMKKLLALGLASAMTLSLASCGNNNDTPATGSEGKQCLQCDRQQRWQHR